MATEAKPGLGAVSGECASDRDPLDVRGTLLVELPPNTVSMLFSPIEWFCTSDKGQQFTCQV